MHNEQNRQKSQVLLLIIINGKTTYLFADFYGFPLVLMVFLQLMMLMLLQVASLEIMT